MKNLKKNKRDIEKLKEGYLRDFNTFYYQKYINELKYFKCETFTKVMNLL